MNGNETNAEIMNVAALSVYLNVSRSTIYKYSQNGTIPARKDGRRWRYHREEIDGWLRTQSGADFFATCREEESKRAAKAKNNTATQGVPFGGLGLTAEQFETLRALSLDTPTKLIKATATTAGRDGLCKALALDEDELDGIATLLIARFDR